MIPDRRPKDWAYMAAFEKKDLPLLYKLAREIRLSHNVSLIEDYLLKCQQKLDDHNPVLHVGNQTLEFSDVIKSDDMAVNAGLQQYINIVLGISATRWRYIGFGVGSTPATVADIALAIEAAVPRVDMSLVGWREANGMKLFFGGVIGETASVTSIVEMGVFNNAAGATMLNRNVFGNNGAIRSSNTAVFILSSVIELVPTV